MVEVLEKLKLDKISLEKLSFLKLRKRKEEGIVTNVPMHIAFTMHGTPRWAQRNKVSEEEALEKKFLTLRNTLKAGVELNIPMMTFYLLSTNLKEEETEKFALLIDKLVDFFEKISTDELVQKNKIKITVLGKWYNLPGRAVESIRKVIDNTSDYDNFFVNICVNYDGQEEIVDSMKLIARQIISHKIGVDSINKELIKENLYSSYILPPDLIVKTGKKEIPDLLIWDSINSNIYFPEKLWPDFDKGEFNKAIDYWKKNK